MSRLAHLVRHPRRTLAVLATVTTAVGFTASSANPVNTFSTGTLTMSNSSADAAVLTAAGLRPGDSKDGTVDIANTGSLSGNFSVGRSTLTNTDSTNPLSGKLNLVITDCGAFDGATAPACGNGDDLPKYTGTVAAMASHSLGSFAGGEKHRYQFRVTLDGTAGNEYQGDSSTVTFVWSAA
jgi:spore coat-associated protein N